MWRVRRFCFYRIGIASSLWKFAKPIRTSTARRALAAIASSAAVTAIADAAARKRKVTQLQLDYLREQIEMRVIGLGWDQFKTKWSAKNDPTIGTVKHLKSLLLDIIAPRRRAITPRLYTLLSVPYGAQLMRTETLVESHSEPT